MAMPKAVLVALAAGWSADGVADASEPLLTNFTCTFGTALALAHQVHHSTAAQFLTKISPNSDKCWHFEPPPRYPIGLLFGLGFDTSSEVALLGLAAMGPDSNVPPAGVLMLPLLFTAGMSLLGEFLVSLFSELARYFQCTNFLARLQPSSLHLAAL
jgi:hypothetical protein